MTRLITLCGLVCVLGLAFSNSGIKTYKGFESPEILVNEYVKALSSGRCEDARKMSVGRAKEITQACIDSGCEMFETRIMEIKCEVIQDSAKCVCSEERSGDLKMDFNYYLQKSGKKWKVEYYEKDISDLNK